MRFRNTTISRNGFTIVELVVVVAIIAVLIGIVLPATLRVRASGLGTQCKNNLRQVALALGSYAAIHQALPSGIRGKPDRYPYMGWPTRIMVHLEQSAIWDNAVRDYAQQSWFWGPPQHSGLSTVIPVLVCPLEGRSSGWVVPEDGEAAFTHYLGVSGQGPQDRDGVLFVNSNVRIVDIRDGTSNTLLLAERPPSPENHLGWWYAGVGQTGDGSADMLMSVRETRTTDRMPTCPYGPYHFQAGSSSNVCDVFHFWSVHSGGAHVAFCDGSVRFLKYSADAIMPELATRAGGEIVAQQD